MKGNIKGKLGMLLILAGIIFMVYPIVGKWVTQYKQNQLIRDWQENGENANEYVGDNQEIDFIQAYKTLHKDLPAGNSGRQEVIGTISIEKIDIKLPLIMGATQENLKYGAAQLRGTTPIGQIGNTAVAGHRSYTHGKFFSRLKELDNGDKIVVKTKEGIYTYRVYDKKVVEPTDLSVLEGNGQDSILTLITCEPIFVGSHRFIIHGKLVEKP